MDDNKMSTIVVRARSTQEGIANAIPSLQSEQNAQCLKQESVTAARSSGCTQKLTTSKKM
jgi:hypothetical protein